MSGPTTVRGVLPRVMAALVALVAAAGGLPVAPVAAQTPSPERLASISDCPVDATSLVAVVTASNDPDRAALVGDLANQLATIRTRRIEFLVGWAGAVFEPVAPWEQITPETAPRLAGLVNQAAETGVVAALDPTELLDQVVAQLDEQAAGVSAGACGVVVIDPGDSATGLSEAGLSGRYDGDDLNVVVLPAGRGELVADLAELSGAIRGGVTDTDTMAVCAEVGCERGTVEIDLPAVLGGFAITVVLPDENADVVVGLPRGASFPISAGSAGQISAGSFDIRTSWPAPGVMRLQAEVSPTETDWPGTWTISTLGAATTDPDAEAVVITSVAAGVVPQFAGSVRLAAGRPVTIRAEIVDHQGRLIDDAGALDAVDLAVVALDPEGVELAQAELTPGPSGVWTASLGLDPEVETDTVTLRLVASIDGGRGNPIEVAAETVSDVLPVAVWPRAGTDPITVEADAGSQTTSTVTIAAGAGVDACAWIEDASVDLGGVAAPVTLAGGARSMASCVRVPADTTAELPLSFDLAEVSPGSYPAAVNLSYGPMGDEAFETVEIELAFDVNRPINFARRVQITIGMALIALVVPLFALWVLDWVKARFRPPRRAMAAEAWISVWSDGSIYRIDTDGSPLLLGPDDFEPAGLTRARRFSWRGLDLWVRNPTSPLSPPIAVVGSSSGPVGASMGAVVDDGTVVGRVPLNLAPTWIFELEPEATREAAVDPTAPDFYAAYGRLIIIRHVNAPAVDTSELAALAQRLALTVRRARRPAEGTAQEMLDFVEVNVSTPRDLPRRHGAGGEAAPDDQPPAPPVLATTSDPYDFSDLASLFTSDDPDHPDGSPLPDDGHRVDDPPEEGPPEDGDRQVEGHRVDALDPAAAVDEASGAEPAVAVDGSSGPEAYAPDADDAPFGIVFEESVNVDAFLSATDSDTSDGFVQPAEAQRPAELEPEPEPEPEQPPADPRTSWARRSRPSWPTARDDRDR